MISNEDKERVRRETDFKALVSETVELRQRGRDFWGCCPFHHEKSPSFHIMPDTGLWKCFGCGAGGDVFSYVMKRENLEFQDAIRYLADKANIELTEEQGVSRGPKRSRIIECLTEAEDFYAKVLMRGKGRGAAEGRAYLAGRQFGSAVAKRWRLGYAPGSGQLTRHLQSMGFTTSELDAADLCVSRSGRTYDRFYERVMFPIHDEGGRTIGFGGRVMGDGKPKYLNSRETSVFHKGRNLFGFDVAKEAIAAKGAAIVCEGYTDVISMSEHGIKNVVAALGTALTLEHVTTLTRFAKLIICLFDGDAAGQRAAERAIQYLDKTTADLRYVVLPDNLDPAEFLGRSPASELERTLDGAKPLMDFVLEKRLEGVDPTSLGGVRIQKADELATVLAPLKQSVLLDEYANVVASRLGLKPDYIRKQIQQKPYDPRSGSAATPQGFRSQGPRGERPQSYGGRAQGMRTQDPRAGGSWSGPQSSGGGAPDYEDYGYEAADYVPDDYLPAEAEGATPTAVPQAAAAPRPASEAFTRDEAVQLRAEMELLAMMARDIELFRPYSDRIAQLAWADERHEAMAWAMLATPSGCGAKAAVEAALSVTGDAAEILASGQVATSDGMDDEKKVAFVLDTVELYSTRRKIAAIRARIRSGDATSAELFGEATELQRHATELLARLKRSS